MSQKRMTAEEYRNLTVSTKAKSKYRNVRTTVDGIAFDSAKEAQRYCELRILERAGKINDLRLQVPFILVPKNKNGNQLQYIADFVYWDCESEKEAVEDTKGMKTQVYKIKKRLMAELGYKIYET